jgi:hypothetical protein
MTIFLHFTLVSKPLHHLLVTINSKKEFSGYQLSAFSPKTKSIASQFISLTIDETQCNVFETRSLHHDRSNSKLPKG